MNKTSECATCAWRADCKLKYNYETSGLYCKEYTKDLTLFPPEEGIKEVAGKDKKDS